MIYDRLMEMARENGVVLDEKGYMDRVDVADMVKEVVPGSRRGTAPLGPISSSGSLGETEVRVDAGAGMRADDVTNESTDTGANTDTSAKRDAMRGQDKERVARPQHLRAYKWWWEKESTVEAMCAELRLAKPGSGSAGNDGGGLKPGTVMCVCFSLLLLALVFPLASSENLVLQCA